MNPESAPSSTEAVIAPFIPKTDPVETVLPWCGALGHRVFLVSPTDTDSIYGGWRTYSEAGVLDHVMDLYRPGMRIFERVRPTGSGGTVRRQYVERTPGCEHFPINPREAQKHERCYVCGKPTTRIGSTGKFKTGFCEIHRSLGCGDPERLHEWRNREIARVASEHAAGLIKASP